MALDYREERKWKITMAYLIGQEVLAYHRHKQNLLSSSNASDGMDIDNYGPPVTNIKFSFDCPVVFYHEAPSSESAEAAYKPLTSSDQYVDPLALYPVVPASRLIQTRFKDRAGQPAIAASLPGTQTYSGPLSPAISTFYSPSYESKSISLSAPAQPKSSSMRPSVMWTSEEDEILLKLSPQFQYNWTVISECVNSNINQVAPRKIPWDCYVRWQHLQSKPSPNLQKSRKDDLRRRAMRHIHFFDGISKVIKKRDAQQKKPSTPTAGGAGSTKSSSSSKPNLTAHLSHQAIASRAGVDPKRWRTPLEQNERRQKLQVTAQQRVQGMLMQQPGGMAAIPGRPAAPRPPGLYNGGMPGMAGQPQQPPPVSGSAPAVPSAGGIAGTPNGGMASIPSPPNASRMAQPNGGPAPSTANAAARMPGAPMGMTQAQVQQLFQRQAMAMQQGQQSGSPPNIPGNRLRLNTCNLID
jgi:hypothetical protein